MSTLLTPEEMVEAIWNWGQALSEEQANTIDQRDRFQCIATAQLRKVIREIESICEDFPDDPDDFTRNVLLLVEMAKEEIGC